MKKIICVSIIFAVLCTFANTSIAESVAAESSPVKINKELSIEDAIGIAASNSRQAVIDDLEIAAKETAVKKAVEDAGSVAGGITPAAALRDRITVKVKVREAEANLEIAKKTKADNAAQLEKDVKSTFYNILLAQMELKTAEEKLKFTEERLNMAKSRYGAKTITKDDLDMAEYNLYSRNIEVESIKEKLRNLDMKLKDQLGMPLEGEMLQVKGTIIREKVPEVDIDRVVKENLETDTAVYAATEKYIAAKTTMELTAELFKQGSETYDNNMVSQESALRDYDAAKRNREVEIRNTYNDLLNLKDSADLAERYEELQRKIADNVKIKYEKGTVSKETYMAAEESYLDAVYGKYKSICELNGKILDFDNLINKK